DAVRRAPHSIVLLDEIDKAHPKVTDLLLKIFDDGQLSDAHGRVADFRHSIIILASNLGSGGPCWDASRPSGPVIAPPPPADGTPHADDADSPDELRRELGEHFRPELLNRINRVVPFRPLDLTDVRAVIDRIIGRVREERLRGKGVELRLAPSAYDALVDLG